jgi:hypothetical protein
MSYGYGRYVEILPYSLTYYNGSVGIAKKFSIEEDGVNAPDFSKY